MFDGLDVSQVTQMFPRAADWELVKRLRDTVTVKFLIKGIVTREDAQLAVEHGVDGLIVSNHGGRTEDTLRPTIESLPEVVEAVAGKAPVIVDGGVRRGTDIFKALALGATAVGFGRPHSWGLGAFGRPVLKQSWKSIDANCAPSCARRERPRSTKLRATLSSRARPDCDASRGPEAQADDMPRGKE